MEAVVRILADNGVRHMDGWGGGWMWIWGTLMMVGVVFALVWIVRTATDSQRGPTPGDASLERARAILAERYARGELTTEQYREQLDHLV